MASAFPRFQLHDWAQRFQLKKVGVGKDLEVASEIRIAGVGQRHGALDHQCALSIVRSPAGRVEDTSHLFGETSLGMAVLSQLNELRTETPSRVRQVGERP